MSIFWFRLAYTKYIAEGEYSHQISYWNGNQAGNNETENTHEYQQRLDEEEGKHMQGMLAYYFHANGEGIEDGETFVVVFNI